MDVLQSSAEDASRVQERLRKLRDERTRLDEEERALKEMLVAMEAATGSAPNPLTLYAWQREALAEWRKNDSRGVIEAVTGAGKTRIGIAAASDAIADARSVVALVPTRELQRQWAVTMQGHLPDARIGLVGGDAAAQSRDDDITIAVVNSAAARPVLRRFRSALLIADECHRYAGDTFAQALDTSVDHRLGLTATYARPDEMHKTRLDPYFGGVVYSLGYARALDDDVIAPFDIHFVGVSLSSPDLAEYRDLTSRIRRMQSTLERHFGNQYRNFAEFMKLVSKTAAESSSDRITILCRLYTKHISDRRTLLADNDVKEALLEALAPAVHASQGSLVFTNTRAAAIRAVEVLAATGVTATAVHSDQSSKERRAALDAFRGQEHQLLAAPRVLDEGIDVPEADLAIIISANRSRRQMVQRLGRVIRKKPDGRHGRMIVIYAIDTIEDPNIGSSHDDYLKEIVPHAADLRFWDASHDLFELLAILGSAARPLTEAEALLEDGVLAVLPPRELPVESPRGVGSSPGV